MSDKTAALLATAVLCWLLTGVVLLIDYTLDSRTYAWVAVMIAATPFTFACLWSFMRDGGG